MASLGTPINSKADVWSKERPLPDYRNLRILPVEHRRIHACEGDHRFLLGVSMVHHNGRFVSAWGASAKDENDVESIFAYKTSTDARAWSKMKPVAHKPAGPDAHGHGVLLSTGDTLWAFAPRAHFADIMEYPDLRMETFSFDEAKQAWESRGESAPGFWPLCEPQRMEDGNWIMGGAVPHRAPHCDAAVAISRGDDLTKWRVVTIPYRAERQTLCGLCRHQGKRRVVSCGCEGSGMGV